ncbi:MAG: glycoside hydrolase family 5 protein [Alphaproteobacteria bacterium]|nr:glycoside hydrolase family 5 protein [Alphaproteobacteria bacterium]
MKTLFLLMFLLIFPFTSVMANGEGIPFDANRGVNLGGWVANAVRQPLDARDAALIKNAGFDYVRLPYNPSRFGFDIDNPNKKEPVPNIAALDDALALLMEHGLNVVLDMHIDTSLRVKVEGNDALEDAMISLWHYLSARYSVQYPPERLAFQLLNEPQYYHKIPAWNRFQKRLWRSVRLAAPKHTIIASPPIGGNTRTFGLEDTTLLPDKNVIYTFPFYEPFIISHQGEWNIRQNFKHAFGRISGLSYPAALSLDQNFTIISDDIPKKTIFDAVAAYQQENWDGDKIRERLRLAAEWASKRGVPLMICEFGAMDETSGTDKDSRLRYLRDVRKAAESYGIPWTVWNYTDMMGITVMNGETETTRDGAIVFVNPSEGYRTFDPEMLEALGLTP